MGIPTSLEPAIDLESAEYAVHPLAVAYVKKIGHEHLLCVETFASEPCIKVADARLIWSLLVLPQRFSFKTAISIWSAQIESPDISQELWTFCLSESLIIPATESNALETTLPAAPDRKNWQMVLYHGSTRDYPFLNMSEAGSFGADNAVMQRYALENKPPSAYQEFQYLTRTSLDRLTDLGNVDNYVSNLQTSERFQMPGLSVLLNFCFGERERIPMSFLEDRRFLQVEIMKKTIPSGGGKHPLEAFLVVPPERFLAHGLYHYNVCNNSVDQIINEDPSNFCGEWVSVLGFSEPRCSFGIVLASLCERAMWRYRDPRSWRALVIDVGHAINMLSVVATRIGYKLLAKHHGFHEPLSKALRLDPFSQPIMFIGCLQSGQSDG